MNTPGERPISRFLVNNDFHTELYDFENRLGIILTMMLLCCFCVHFQAKKLDFFFFLFLLCKKIQSFGTTYCTE